MHSWNVIAGAGDGGARVCTATSRVLSRLDLVLGDAGSEPCLLCESPCLLGLECISSDLYSLAREIGGWKGGVPRTNQAPQQS